MCETFEKREKKKIGIFFLGDMRRVSWSSAAVRAAVTRELGLRASGKGRAAAVVGGTSNVTAVPGRGGGGGGWSTHITSSTPTLLPARVDININISTSLNERNVGLHSLQYHHQLLLERCRATSPRISAHRHLHTASRAHAAHENQGSSGSSGGDNKGSSATATTDAQHPVRSTCSSPTTTSLAETCRYC